MGPTMIRHFGPTVALQSAIVVGELPAAKRAAENLISRLNTEKHPVEWGPSLNEVRDAAKAVTRAETLEAAATATAHLGFACGKCHDNLDVPFDEVALPLTTTPPADLPQAMHRHLRAADDLWLSLLGASDERWAVGAANLAQANVYPIEEGATSDTMRATATRFHALAEVAQTTRAPAERAALYGNLLGTCARCHSEIDKSGQ
jgi:cytochrome c553